MSKPRHGPKSLREVQVKTKSQRGSIPSRERVQDRVKSNIKTKQYSLTRTDLCIMCVCVCARDTVLF